MTPLPAFLVGVAVGLFVAGLVALNLWHRRDPMTPEESEALDDEMRIY